MKRLRDAAVVSLGIVYALFPLIAGIGWLAGYTCLVRYPAVLAAVAAVLSVVTAVVVWRYRPAGRGMMVVAALLPLLAGVQGVLLLRESENYEIVAVVLATVVSVLCALLIAGKLIDHVAAKIITLLASCLLLSPLVLVMLGAIAFSPLFGETSVMRTELSPDAAYRVEIVDHDEGAMGGSTVVRVRENADIDLWLICLQKPAREVYFGQWDAYRSMAIEWQDADTLCVNGETFDVSAQL